MCKSDYCLILLTDYHFLLCRVVDLEKLHINNIIIKFFPDVFYRYNRFYRFLLKNGLLSICYTIEYGCKQELIKFQELLIANNQKDDSKIYFFSIRIFREKNVFKEDTKLISI